MEGADLVAAGLACGYRPQVVFVRAERGDELVAALGLYAPAAGPPPAVYPVTERVASRISTLETPPDVSAVFPLLPKRPLSSLTGVTSPEAPALLPTGTRQARRGALVVYLDAVQDPGNVGTLLRAAVAFGAAAVVTGPGSADLYGPKTVRSGMGALFAVPVAADVPLSGLTDALGAPRVYGLTAHGGTALHEADLDLPAVLVVGSERHGISAVSGRSVTDHVTIPLAPARSGAVESLNAGVAGAIALYEFSRRSAGAPDDVRPRPAAPAKG